MPRTFSLNCRVFSLLVVEKCLQISFACKCFLVKVVIVLVFFPFYHLPLYWWIKYLQNFTTNIIKTRRWHVTISCQLDGTPAAASSTLEEWRRTFSREQQCSCFRTRNTSCRTQSLSNATFSFLSASLYVSKRDAYWDRLWRDVVGRWLSRACTVAKRCILGL